MKNPIFTYKPHVVRHKLLLEKAMRLLLCFCLALTAYPLQTTAYAQEIKLPAPGVMVHLSPEFNPTILKGIKVHPDNPFKFEFILDQGDSVGAIHESPVQKEALKDEANKLIRYFLASVTTPEKDLWVNLSPYERDRIIPTSFGLTEMGRDLLAQDYMLKQITASLIYPEDQVGRKFWKRIYEEAAKKYGNTNIPVNTFNKVWIVPEKAVVYENAKAGTAYVVESRLKVMLEEDYLSTQKHNVGAGFTPAQNRDGVKPSPTVNGLGSQIIREIVIPELTKEVNEGKNFSQLRQVYNSMILATWYKKKIKDSILAKIYADKNKTKGIDTDDPTQKDKIYKQYVQAFKKGVYNYIKEEVDPLTQQSIPRKYFSGGVILSMDEMMAGQTNMKTKSILIELHNLPAGESSERKYVVNADADPMGVDGMMESKAPPAENLLVTAQVQYDEEKSLKKIKSSEVRRQVEVLLASLRESIPNGLARDQKQLIDYLQGEGRLAELGSLLRTQFPYERDDNDPRGALQYAIEENLFFGIGEDLYISPETGSFRRHCIFRVNKEGQVNFASEFMIPGDHILKNEFDPAERQAVAEDINKTFEGKEYSVNILSHREIPYQGKNLYGKPWPSKTIQMAFYEYKYDGRRFTKITNSIKVDMARQLNISTKTLEQKLVQGAMECFLSFRMSGYLGLRDAHAENLRVGMVYDSAGKAIDLKVQLVADFEDFVKTKRSKLAWTSGLAATALLPFALSDPNFGGLMTIAFLSGLPHVSDYYYFFMNFVGSLKGLYTSSLSPAEIIQAYIQASNNVFAGMSNNDKTLSRLAFSIKQAIGVGVVGLGVGMIQVMGDERGASLQVSDNGRLRVVLEDRAMNATGNFKLDGNELKFGDFGSVALADGWDDAGRKTLVAGLEHAYKSSPVHDGILSDRFRQAVYQIVIVPKAQAMAVKGDERYRINPAQIEDRVTFADQEVAQIMSAISQFPEQWRNLLVAGIIYEAPTFANARDVFGSKTLSIALQAPYLFTSRPSFRADEEPSPDPLEIHFLEHFLETRRVGNPTIWVRPGMPYYSTLLRTSTYPISLELTDEDKEERASVEIKINSLGEDGKDKIVRIVSLLSSILSTSKGFDSAQGRKIFNTIEQHRDEEGWIKEQLDNLPSFKDGIKGIEGWDADIQYVMDRMMKVDSQNATEKNILWVDDNGELANTVAHFFKDGYRVKVVTDTKAAMAEINGQTKFDLVITDYHMPKETGGEFAKRLSKSHPKLKVIVNTGADQRDEQDQIQKQSPTNIIAVMPKGSVSSTALVNKVYELLGDRMMGVSHKSSAGVFDQDFLTMAERIKRNEHITYAESYQWAKDYLNRNGVKTTDLWENGFAIEPDSDPKSGFGYLAYLLSKLSANPEHPYRLIYDEDIVRDAVAIADTENRRQIAIGVKAFIESLAVGKDIVKKSVSTLHEALHAWFDEILKKRGISFLSNSEIRLDNEGEGAQGYDRYFIANEILTQLFNMRQEVQDLYSGIVQGKYRDDDLRILAQHSITTNLHSPFKAGMGLLRARRMAYVQRQLSRQLIKIIDEHKNANDLHVWKASLVNTREGLIFSDAVDFDSLDKKKNYQVLITQRQRHLDGRFKDFLQIAVQLPHRGNLPGGLLNFEIDNPALVQEFIAAMDQTNVKRASRALWNKVMKESSDVRQMLTQMEEFSKNFLVSTKPLASYMKESWDLIQEYRSAKTEKQRSAKEDGIINYWKKNIKTIHELTRKMEGEVLEQVRAVVPAGSIKDEDLRFFKDTEMGAKNGDQMMEDRQTSEVIIPETGASYSSIYADKFGQPIIFWRGEIGSENQDYRAPIFVTPNRSTAESYQKTAGDFLGFEQVRNHAASLTESRKNMLAILLRLPLDSRKLAALQVSHLPNLRILSDLNIERLKTEWVAYPEALVQILGIINDQTGDFVNGVLENSIRLDMVKIAPVQIATLIAQAEGLDDKEESALSDKYMDIRRNYLEPVRKLRGFHVILGKVLVVHDDIDPDVITKAREQGYDSIWHENGVGNRQHPEIVILNPAQLSQKDENGIQILQPQDRNMGVKRGGIDLTAEKTPLEIQNGGEAIKFHLDEAMLARLQNAPGFTAKITDIQPLDDLPAFLGATSH